MLMFLLPLVAAIAVFAGLALWLLVMLDRARRAHKDRLTRVTGTRTTPEQTQLAAAQARVKSGTPTGLVAYVEEQLALTGLRVSPTELLVQLAVAALSIYGLSVLFLGLHPLIALPVSLIVPSLVALWVLRIVRNRYRATFTEGLPEALDVFARGLRAGRPIPDSLEIVVETATGPIQTECEKVHSDLRMGTTLPEALARLDTRIATPEVSFFAVATSLQSETGGNLIETIENLSQQLRERRKLRKKARALTAEARASALILAALPFAVALAIALLNGGYLAPLYTDTRGQIMSVAALCSIGLGIYIMTRMGKLDV